MKYNNHGQTKTIQNLCLETGADTTDFLLSIGQLPFSQSHSRLVENMFLRTSITDKVRSPIPGSGTCGSLSTYVQATPQMAGSISSRTSTLCSCTYRLPRRWLIAVNSIFCMFQVQYTYHAGTRECA